MAYQQRLLVADQGSVSPTLYGFSMPLYALAMASLFTAFEALPSAKEQADVTKEKPIEDRMSYSMSISIGELCNTAVYDDSASKAVEDLVKRVLGVRAGGRFSELRRIKAGWDFGKGGALSRAAVKNLSALLSRVRNAPPNVKLFLSNDGSLEIQWKSVCEERTSMLFKDDGFEVLRPGRHEERTFSDSDFQGVLVSAGLV